MEPTAATLPNGSRFEDRYEILAGESTIAVPRDTMHSFEAKHNKVVWELRVHADIRRWPDVREEFRFTVLPEIAEGES